MATKKSPAPAAQKPGALPTGGKPETQHVPPGTQTFSYARRYGNRVIIRGGRK